MDFCNSSPTLHCLFRHQRRDRPKIFPRNSGQLRHAPIAGSEEQKSAGCFVAWDENMVNPRSRSAAPNKLAGWFMLKNTYENEDDLGLAPFQESSIWESKWSHLRYNQSYAIIWWHVLITNNENMIENEDHVATHRTDRTKLKSMGPRLSWDKSQPVLSLKKFWRSLLESYDRPRVNQQFDIAWPWKCHPFSWKDLETIFPTPIWESRHLWLCQFWGGILNTLSPNTLYYSDIKQILKQSDTIWLIHEYIVLEETLCCWKQSDEFQLFGNDHKQKIWWRVGSCCIP